MRIKALLGVAALAASAATCVAQSNVYSLNIVGYVNVDLAAGWNLIANPLKPSDGNYSITNLISLPDEADSAQLYAWTGTGWSAGAIWTPGYGWDTGDAAAPVVELGEAFFVNSPVATKVTFVGEVATGTISSTFSPGFNMVANKVPVQQRWPGADNGNDSDQIYRFQNGGWTGATIYTEGFGWGEDEATKDGPELRVGEGVAYKNEGAELTWTRDFNP